MSHIFFNYPAGHYYYHSEHFGHPHLLAEPTYTEPFHHQHPAWAVQEVYPQHQTYLLEDSAGMDSEPTYIGSNTANGRRLPPNTNIGKGKKSFGPNNGKKYSGPKGMVDIYAAGVFMGRMPLGVLTRFSKQAAAAFPRPTESADDSKDDAKSELDTKGGAEADETPSDVNKATASMDKLTVESVKAPEFVPGAKPSADNENAGNDTTTTSAPKETPQPHLVLELGLEHLWVKPPKDAFEFVFAWMHRAKTTHRGDKPVDFGVPRPDALAVPLMIDFYAAAMALDIRPFPIKHKHDVLTRLSEVPPSLDDIRYIHDHLPLDDPILTRALTSFAQNRGARRNGSYAYTKAERQDIENYIFIEDPQLYARWQEILDNRRQRQQSFRKDREADQLQNLAEGIKGTVSAIAAPAKAPPVNSPSSSSTGKKADSKVDDAVTPEKDDANKAKPSGSKTEDKPGNGRGIKGRHVPGA